MSFFRSYSAPSKLLLMCFTRSGISFPVARIIANCNALADSTTIYSLKETGLPRGGPSRSGTPCGARARADCRDKPRTGPMAVGARNCTGANESESVLRVERSCHKQVSILKCRQLLGEAQSVILESYEQFSRNPKSDREAGTKGACRAPAMA